METHLHREIDRLKSRILELGALVEDSLRKAITSVSQRNNALANEVIDGDDDIDRMEVDIEEECLEILARYQPVASDLRFIIAVLKLNNDLERIGDLAVNIAQRANNLSPEAPGVIPYDFVGMAEKVQQMLKGALDALVNKDTELARKVHASDEEIDRIHREVYRKVYEGIDLSPRDARTLIPMLTIARHLERIADHATNIAEDVIYTVEGRIQRHRM